MSGDTLFLEGCGRTDLPGGDPAQLYESLTQRLAKVPDDAVLFPGHLYSAEPSATMGETREWNFVFRRRRPSASGSRCSAAEPTSPVSFAVLVVGATGTTGGIPLVGGVEAVEDRAPAG